MGRSCRYHHPISLLPSSHPNPALDLPDIEGDKKFQVETLSTRLGVKPIATAATAVLLLNYAGAVATALLAGPGVYNTAFMAVRV